MRPCQASSLASKTVRSVHCTGVAFEANEASDDDWEAEYQEAVALVTIVKQHRAGKPQSFRDHKADLDKLKQNLPCARCRQLGHWKDHHYCLAKMKRVNWANGSSKLVGELGTVSCVSGSCNSVGLPQIFLGESNVSLLHTVGPENSTCVADVCFYVPNLCDSVVSDCSDTHLRTGDTRPASCTPGHVLGVGDTKQSSCVCQKVSCREPSLFASLCHFSAPNIDSESVVDVCIDRAEEGSCMVSGTSGSPTVGDPILWTHVTNDSWIADGLFTCEPQACANLSLGFSVRSEFDGSKGIAHTYDGGGLEKKASLVRLSQDSQSSYASFGVQSCLCPTGKYG